MNDAVIEAIDSMVDEIYSIDQEKLTDKFILLIDRLSEFINYNFKNNIILNLDNEFLALQNAFSIKDYTLLSDILLYKLKSKIL